MRRQPECCFKDCDHNALPRRAFCGMHSIQRQDKATVIWHGAQLLLTDYGRLDVDIMPHRPRPHGPRSVRGGAGESEGITRREHDSL